MITEDMLKNDLGREFEKQVIGPAGENKIKFACISRDFGRQAGRTVHRRGHGFKNLKAVAVKTPSRSRYLTRINFWK